MAEEETKMDSSKINPSNGKLEQGSDGVYSPTKIDESSKAVKLSKAEQIRTQLSEVEEDFVKGWRKGMKLIKAIGDFLNE